jgi:hypothetical protein
VLYGDPSPRVAPSRLPTAVVIVILGMMGVALYVERDCGLAGGLLGFAVALASAFYFWANQLRM